MSHVTYERVTSHMNESRHIRTIHVTHIVRIMSRVAVRVAMQVAVRVAGRVAVCVAVRVAGCSTRNGKGGQCKRRQI